MSFPTDMTGMADKADTVSAFLKGLANGHRLMILCHLSQGECSVGALIEATGLAQTSMSQHLAKLKSEGLVNCRRDHRTLHYFIDHPAVLEIMTVLYRHFCGKDQD
ncbi:metalloregulator ArsR/SmtB family transcription factor [Rhizobium sp. YJ-22]|uniref:ArsR/SmtB family transcription factor n=1 Tax=Rhizobium sp. YJ-22 TaxID=3037556 RepID=UPI0024128937|nr:metalloregulator ArsR/SmtB family transcription factor [Rhizobium sp. YJ-22]MDG3578862.1 metalloregulator ArsR/SmtB family transcription factor [Rhizobium sp. YJ-22]